MKFVHRPKRRRVNQAESRIELFPFLAVLICTMGALVPLLMAISYVARRQAEADALAKAAERTVETQTQLEDVRWRIDMLRQSREKTEADLASARLQLGHLEDHERQLREELKRHKNRLDELDRLKRSDRVRTGGEAEFQRLRAEIDAAARRLADARQRAGEEKPSYAIIPYEGPNRTHRRPIYIECRADAVIMQPEGIELTAGDFNGPLGPDNPLAAALRAAREYMLDRSGFDPAAGEPYPLLLVRPEGIGGYYIAREAMSSWGEDFGYELIGADWELDFPTPDPQMARVVREAVSTARTGQARLAAAAPAHSGVRGKVVYRASPSGGGFVREEAPSNPGGEGGYRTARHSAPVAREYGEISDDSSGVQTSGGAGGSNPLRGIGETAASITDKEYRAGDGEGGYSSPGSDAARSGRAAGEPSTYSSGAGGKEGARPEGHVAGRPPREGERASGDANGRTPLPGEWKPAAERSSDSLADSPPGGPGMKDPKDGPPQQNGSGCPSTKSSNPKSLAAQRGEDWGLRGAARGSTGIQRPIGVACHADRIVVLAENDRSAERVVPLDETVESSIDAVISAVWDRIEGWGIAGQRMYWRPVLKVHVAPGGERCFDELKALLDGSGLTVEKK
ncbi:MAG: hypothetical protein JW959_11980 [Pirellulales bacterium]|nr:hypothetical protein [Pirellulales bacterium]